MRFVLPFATPSLNELQRWHWAKRAKFRDQCALHLRVQRRNSMLPLPVEPSGVMHVEVIRYSAGRLDFDNLAGGAKPLIDALVRERIITDDSPRWLKSEYSQRSAPRGEGCTVIYIEPLLLLRSDGDNVPHSPRTDDTGDTMPARKKKTTKKTAKRTTTARATKKKTTKRKAKKKTTGRIVRKTTTATVRRKKTAKRGTATARKVTRRLGRPRKTETTPIEQQRIDEPAAAVG